MASEEHEEIPPAAVDDLVELADGDAAEVVEMLHAFGLDDEADLLEEENELLEDDEDDDEEL
ncbi:hypothetical protein ACFC1T_08905 [Kitasatospora sp. NPDC056076]|uniref:hypothetical protein n=1 Tax=Kitasatospora sp. NPDC056076 TaxID=3345703 RepID=UPI0035D53EA2